MTDAEVTSMADELFPTLDAIPVRFRLDGPIEQREYLCDGRIVIWDGPRQEVRSPVCVRPGPTVSGPVLSAPSVTAPVLSAPTLSPPMLSVPVPSAPVLPMGTAGAPAPASTAAALSTAGLEQVRLGSYPLLTEQEALRALDSACRAYGNGRGEWPTHSVGARIGHVEDFARRMLSVRDEVVKSIMWEIGKGLADAEKEFDRTVAYIRDTIDAIKELDRASSRFQIDEGVIAQIRRAPLGVVLCMGPFNYPLNETFTTLIPALCMGNVVIFKPPKLGVLLHRPLLEAFRDAFPPGVVNTVYGEGQTVVGPLMSSGRIDVLAFIGSSRVAGVLKGQHPRPHRLRSVLGLEAKNAAIVLPDADLDLAVKECVLGALSYNGQRCTALKILFVHERIVDAFLSRLSTAVNALKSGMPWTEGVQLTPLPEPGKTDALRALIDDAVTQGARVVNDDGGAVQATFMHPAVVYPVGPGMRLYDEEQFGPVIPVVPFDDLEEPLGYIVASNYGQQASVFGSDPEGIAELIDPLVNQVCRVNLNSQCQRGPDTFPFTGRKDSAEGTLSVSDALKVFSIRTLVAAKANDANKAIIRTIVTERRSEFLSTDFLF